MGGDPFAVLKPTIVTLFCFKSSCRMGGDPFAVLKPVRMLQYTRDILCRMGGDPFAVLKPRDLDEDVVRGKDAAWGETLLRY